MSPTLLKTALRDQLRRPWLTALLILSVALGVAVVVAVDLANESASRAFSLSTEAITGKATHQIVGGPDGIDESVYRTLRVDEAYRQSAPIVEGYGGALELGGQTMHVLGVDMFAEPPFRNYLTANTEVPLDAFADFFTKPGAVFISADSAARFGVVVGDTITLVIGTHPHSVTVAGLLKTPNAVSARALDGLMLTDISTAQELFDMQGKLSRIDLIATPDMAKTIAAILPNGLRIQSASVQADTITQLTAAFNLNLTAFSLLALAVGMFLIYNTTMFSVVQRRRVLGILRCVGVTGQEIFRLILFESALSGALGALIGLGLGILLARLTVALITQTINDLYFSITVRSVDIEPFTMLKGLLLGILAAVLASILPALEAANVPAVSVLQRSDLEARVRRSVPNLTRIGLAAIIAGTLLILLIQDNVNFSFAGIFIALIGVTLCVPLLTIGLMRLVVLTFGRFGLLSRMAAQTVTQALSRTSVAIAALIVAIAVTIGVTVMIASFRATVENWLDQTLRADLYISPPLTGANRISNLDPALVEKIRAVQGVDGVEMLRTVFVDSPAYGQIQLNAVTAVVQRNTRTFRFAQGDPAAIWNQVAQGAVVVTEPFANRHHLPASGAQVTLDTERGAHTFPVVGVYYDYSSDQGSVLMSLDVYRQYWNDPNITAASVYLAPNAPRDQVIDSVRAALAGNDVVVQSNQALRDTALVIFDRTFAITLTLRLIAVVVAFIGVFSALMALQLERTRELGTLRAVGMTLRQLWQLTLTESGLMGATAGLLSIPLGLALSAVLIYVINLRSFGWTIFFQPVPETYVEAFFVSTIAALLAAIYPMLRLRKMETAEALREE